MGCLFCVVVGGGGKIGMGLEEDEGCIWVEVVVDRELGIEEILGEDEIKDKDGLSFGDLPC